MAQAHQTARFEMQADVVWQNDERPGRESLKRGIAFIRECYPDAMWGLNLKRLLLTPFLCYAYCLQQV